jgi:hypothetical protein
MAHFFDFVLGIGVVVDDEPQNKSTKYKGIQGDLFVVAHYDINLY